MQLSRWCTLRCCNSMKVFFLLLSSWAVARIENLFNLKLFFLWIIWSFFLQTQEHYNEGYNEEHLIFSDFYKIKQTQWSKIIFHFFRFFFCTNLVAARSHSTHRDEEKWSSSQRGNWGNEECRDQHERHTISFAYETRNTSHTSLSIKPLMSDRLKTKWISYCTGHTLKDNAIWLSLVKVCFIFWTKFRTPSMLMI